MMRWWSILLAICVAPVAYAQPAYPTKPIRVIILVVPGGGVFVMAINPRAFGAVGLATSSLCSTSVNSSQITITPSGDFQNGQTVMCAHAGLTSTATPPTSLTAGPAAWRPATRSRTT